MPIVKSLFNADWCGRSNLIRMKADFHTRGADAIGARQGRQLNRFIGHIAAGGNK
jgi:hypothetical protein